MYSIYNLFVEFGTENEVQIVNGEKRNVNALDSILNHCLVALRQKRLMQRPDLQRATAVQVFLPRSHQIYPYSALTVEYLDLHREIKLILRNSLTLTTLWQ